MPTNWPAGTPEPAANGMVEPAVSLIVLMPLSWMPPLPPGTPRVKRRCAASPLHAKRSVKLPTTARSLVDPLVTDTSMRCADGPGCPSWPGAPSWPGSPFGPRHAGSLERHASPLSPFAPGVPGEPGVPGSPWSPFGPGGPGSPLLAAVPGRPWSPLSPFGPGRPCGPVVPPETCCSPAIARLALRSARLAIFVVRVSFLARLTALTALGAPNAGASIEAERSAASASSVRSMALRLPCIRTSVWWSPAVWGFERPYADACAECNQPPCGRVWGSCRAASFRRRMLPMLLALLLGAVLVGSALLKLADGPRTRAALGTYGIHGDTAARLAWGGLIAVELVLAVAVVAGVEAAGWAGAALFAGFTVAQAVALTSGRAGAPCACFGARGRVGRGSLARAAGLTVAFAVLPLLDRREPSTEGWLGIGLVAALLGIVGLGVAVLALARELASLRAEIDPRGAL